MEEAQTEYTTKNESEYNLASSGSANSERSGDLNSTKEKYLTLTEASQLAGVSTSTLMRFAEAGYFKIFNSDSEIKFSDSEIAQIFGVTFNYTKSSTPKSSINQIKVAESAKTVASENSLKTEDSKRVATESSLAAESSQIQDVKYKSLASQVEVIIETTEATSSSTNENLEPFKKVLQLQEELLAQKNTVIADLIKERDWLRTRLEKMEEKSERDQMLLMVESQKVRSLIASDTDSHNKLGTSNAGFLNKALAWFK